MNKITVLLADDHTVVRQGLRALLDADPELEVIGEAENGREAVALAKQRAPDVVIMDVAMPLLNGLEATRQLVTPNSHTRILVLTSYGDDECVRQLMRAGASGFLAKNTAANELLKAIREVQKGNVFYSSTIAQRFKSHRGASLSKKSSALTSRESEVLQLIAEGFSNKQIAAELRISIKTVEKHRQQVMNKLNIHEIAGLTRYAISQGMIEGELPAAI